ncbi:hypothetical protein RND71_027192 [Anisodus tanguticus]|uniref:RIN4 pathogenic type III effector avirulence factor Avr cleavage site domain-containing protein n=1 Tax=Anisodus tanguticus TaxID=243964 RepID=A0AAE1V3I3_9SOLA|nr:hypothetical protein RND71_027192 [Anisodus tanguticus]
MSRPQPNRLLKFQQNPPAKTKQPPQGQTKQKNGPTFVPQFGAWDNNAAAGGGGYTVEFSKARANKQHQHKNGLGAHYGLTNDQEFQHQQQKNGLDARQGLKNDKEFQPQQNKNGLDASRGLKNDKEFQPQQNKNGLDARRGLKNDKEFQPQQNENGLDARRGLKNDRNFSISNIKMQKNGLGTRHELAKDQEFQRQHQQHKNGLGVHQGLTNDPGKKQEDLAIWSVPQFGMWDQQAGGATSYTVEFSKARVNKKQHKNNDILARPPSIDHEQEALRKQHEDSCMGKCSFVVSGAGASATRHINTKESASNDIKSWIRLCLPNK